MHEPLRSRRVVAALALGLSLLVYLVVSREPPELEFVRNHCRRERLLDVDRWEFRLEGDSRSYRENIEVVIRARGPSRPEDGRSPVRRFQVARRNGQLELLVVGPESWVRPGEWL